MRGTLQYRFTTARVQWPCSTDIHWAYLITQSGPARYVTNRRLLVPIEWPKVENKLRVRFRARSETPGGGARRGGQAPGSVGRARRNGTRRNKNPKKQKNTTHLCLFFIFFFVEDRKVAVKNYAVHQSLEDPGSASQQPECNGPAPH